MCGCDDKGVKCDGEQAASRNGRQGGRAAYEADRIQQVHILLQRTVQEVKIEQQIGMGDKMKGQRRNLERIQKIRILLQHTVCITRMTMEQQVNISGEG